tara:strand:- start:1564 stop:2091 length:528 start_codon:yes stop_codon:yes gene_type:complete
MSNHDGGLFRAMAHGTQAEAREALATLFGRHAPDVTRFLRRMLGNDPMAEDLTHDTFLTAARNAAAFQGGDARPWLLTLAARRATDELRSRRRRARREHTVSRPESAPVQPDGELESTLATLPARERAAVELRIVDGLTHAQVARVLGVSLRTAKSWSSDGLERLRRTLGEEQDA